MIRVLIVDDHPVVHDGVAAVLHRTPDIRVVDTARTIAEATAKLSRVKPDIVLLDLRLPDAEGLSGIGAVLSAQPGVGVIVFTAYDLDEYVFGAIRAGARGYLIKGAPGTELAAAIRQVSSGESYVSPRLSAKLIDQVRSGRRGSRLLSARELTVLRLMAAGSSNRQIADALEITERTVKFHVTAILNKLGADNRTQAVALAGRRGILPLDRAE
jgi:DNA-binding NarL/FixJ family response regulator